MAATFLTNQFLIAMPGMADPNFAQTVTLVCEHNAEGALGIVINRPLPMTFGDVFAQLGVDAAQAKVAGDPVLQVRVGREILAAPMSLRYTTAAGEGKWNKTEGKFTERKPNRASSWLRN